MVRTTITQNDPLFEKIIKKIHIDSGVKRDDMYFCSLPCDDMPVTRICVEKHIPEFCHRPCVFYLSEGIGGSLDLTADHIKYRRCSGCKKPIQDIANSLTPASKRKNKKESNW